MSDLFEQEESSKRASQKPVSTNDIVAGRFNLLEHLVKQIAWSAATFGPGPRTKGIIAHLTKELVEIAQQPNDLEEWIDIIILGIDGAWRAGWTPEEIINCLVKKQAKNEARSWPDWRTRGQDEAIEHERDLVMFKTESVDGTVSKPSEAPAIRLVTDDPMYGTTQMEEEMKRRISEEL